MPKKAKILKDIDEFAMKKIEKATTPQISASTLALRPKCKKCQIGDMKLISPIIEMPYKLTGMVLELHECQNCNEREYI